MQLHMNGKKSLTSAPIGRYKRGDLQWRTILRVIKNKTEYKKALRAYESLFDVPDGSEEADTRDVLSLLIEKYEDKHYPMLLPDPIEAIKFRMEQEGLTQKDLVPFIGSKSKVSEVLTGKKELTLKMIRALNRGFPRRCC